MKTKILTGRDYLFLPSGIPPQVQKDGTLILNLMKKYDWRELGWNFNKKANTLYIDLGSQNFIGLRFKSAVDSVQYLPKESDNDQLIFNVTRQIII